MLVFIDNDGARFSLIGSRSRSAASLPIVGATSLEVCRLGLHPWYERVPGVCNLSDGPSRLDFEEVTRLGSKAVELNVTAEGVGVGERWMAWPKPFDHGWTQVDMG